MVNILSYPAVALGKLKAGTTSIEEVVGNTAPDTMR